MTSRSFAVDGTTRLLEGRVARGAARRRAAWKAPPPRDERGYGAMFSNHIGQADEGCDFDFLSAHLPVAEPEIH